jgi:hypothetical protein
VFEILFVNAGTANANPNETIAEVSNEEFNRLRAGSTELGGPNAPLSIEQAIPDVVDVLLAKQGRPGLEYLDRMGRAVPW